MKLKAYSIYDSKGTIFNAPFFQHNAGLALRAFADLANDPQSTLFRHAGDFVLYEVGEFDDTTGLLAPYATHLHLGVASQFKEASRPVVEGLRESLAVVKNGEGVC